MHFSRTLCRMHRPLLYISLNTLLIPTRKSRFESNWVYTFSCLCVDFSGLFVYIGLFYRSLYVHYVYLLERTDSNPFGCVYIYSEEPIRIQLGVCVYLFSIFGFVFTGLLSDAWASFIGFFSIMVDTHV